MHLNPVDPVWKKDGPILPAVLVRIAQRIKPFALGINDKQIGQSVVLSIVSGEQISGGANLDESVSRSPINPEDFKILPVNPDQLQETILIQILCYMKIPGITDAFKLVVADGLNDLDMIAGMR